jgi:thiosulfate reductase cytochrome b subunit
MSSLAVSTKPVAAKAKVIQPAWIRIVHWINAVAMILMIMSGWQIYNASPLFDFNFSSSITLGGWLGGALLCQEAVADLTGGSDRRYKSGLDRQIVA